jgi:hypothetical protein
MGLKKGMTNNPKGRPKKGQTFTDILDAKFSKEEFLEKAWEMAMNGDVAALKYLGDRWEGSPRQTTLIQGDSENPLSGIVVKKAGHGKRTSDQ